jgi:hypothetical protein
MVDPNGATVQLKGDAQFALGGGLGLKLRTTGSTIAQQLSLGRVSDEGQLGTVATPNQFFGFTTAGDLAIRLLDTAHRIHIGVDAGANGAELVIADNKVIVTAPTFQTGPVVSKEAPVNVAHGDFSGGCDMTGATVSDTQLAAAIAYASTAGATGTAAELYVPSGKLKLSAKAQFGTINRLRIFGDGSTSFIQQATDGVPIFEWGAGSTAVQGLIIERLRMEYANQQTVATNPNSSAIRFLTTNATGIFNNVIRDLYFNQCARGITWGDGSASIAFWNNTVEGIYASNNNGGLLRNLSSAAVGGPTNFVKRLTHVGAAVTTQEQALWLGGSTQWAMESIDIEDWTDSVLTLGGSGVCSIHGLHMERHHLVTASVQVFSIFTDRTQFSIEGSSNRFLCDGAGPYYFAFYSNASRGRLSNILTNIQVGSAGSGEFRLVNGSSTSQVELGPRSSNIEPSATGTYVDYAQANSPAPWLVSDCGLPPTQPSTTALPTASATYEGSMLRYMGAAGVADRLVICRKDASNNYAWVDLY